MDEKTIARFWSKVDKDGPVPVHRPELGPCWLWTAYRNSDGYGQFGVGSRTDGTRRVRPAHAFALEIGDDPIPVGLCACHHCDNPSCVRRSHLFVRSRADNNRDAKIKGRIASGDRHGSVTKPDRRGRALGDRNASRKYPEKRPRGEKHWCSKLTNEDVRAIRAATGRQIDIANRFGVDRSIVGKIRARKSWRHVI